MTILSCRQKLSPSWIILAMLLMVVKVCPAADSPDPWSEIRLRLTGTTPVGSPVGIDEYWSGGAGMEMALSTPFRPGDLTAGIILLLYNSGNETRPDFLSRYMFLSWEYAVLLTGRLQGYAGLHCGNWNFHFDDTDVVSAMRSESEFAAGFSAGCTYNLGINWLVVSNWKHTTVFTYKRIRFSHVNLGIGYRYSSPRWLRELLK